MKNFVLIFSILFIVVESQAFFQQHIRRTKAARRTSGFNKEPLRQALTKTLVQQKHTDVRRIQIAGQFDPQNIWKTAVLKKSMQVEKHTNIEFIESSDLILYIKT